MGPMGLPLATQQATMGKSTKLLVCERATLGLRANLIRFVTVEIVHHFSKNEEPEILNYEHERGTISNLKHHDGRNFFSVVSTEAVTRLSNFFDGVL